MDQTESYPVKLYIYDMSRGMARQLSPLMLGRQLDGIWHTAIVIHGKEFFFVGEGINNCPPPGSVVDLGSTEVSAELFMDYLMSLAVSTYGRDKYNLFEHNCNTFSDEVAQFLTGKNIPSYITDLPSEVLSTVTVRSAVFLFRPFGQILRPLLDSISVNPGGSNITGQR
ncbi:hypothetical protein F7725_013925 [Dissostichus mawsoni]|nr:hypothetical protein F7725_013925 [Dissostichus mawsoni]